MAFKALSKSEKAYIQASLQAQSPLRGDGRSLHQFRAVTLQTGVVPIANGSAHLNLGRSSDESMGGTEVLAAAKLEVEDIAALGSSSSGNNNNNGGGRIVCTVSWCVDSSYSGVEKKLTEEAKKSSPAAYSYLSATALDDLQHDYSAILNDVLSHASLRPPNLGIIPGRKAWLLTLDLMVLSDAGNIYDALFMAARAALWDTRVPRTRAVEYRPDKKGGGDGMDVDSEPQSALDTRGAKAPAADFELEDSWDDGVVLGGRDAWPLSVTLNLVRTFFPSCSPFRCLSYRRDTNTVSGCALSGRHNAGGGGHTSASDPDILLPHGITSGSSRDAPTRYRRHRSRSDRVISEGEPLQCPSKKRHNPIYVLTQKDGEKYALQMCSSLNANLKDEELRRTEKARLRFSAAR
jgi:exosome complex component RRP42